MNKQRTVEKFKKVLGSMAIAMALCIIAIGSIKVNAAEIADSETVNITIDNSVSHLGVRFYPDTNDLDNFEYVEVGATETYTVSKDSVARIRIYVQGDGYYLPDGYTVEGATKLTDDDRVNMGWCRAAYTITADATKTITIPEASVCTHPFADPDVRWGYYYRKDGTHAQACTLCSVDIPGTIASHTFTKMTATEYADWYYEDNNFAGCTPEQIATWKAELIAGITDGLGVDANTIINICKICSYNEKIDDMPPETGTQKIKVSKTSISKKYGDKAFTLGATAEATVGKAGALSYKSSNTKVVTVDNAGKVQIKGAGTAVITITAAKTAHCDAVSKTVRIMVSKTTQTIKVSKTSITKDYGSKAFKLDASVKAVAGKAGSLSYKSSNTKIATVDKNGKVTLKGIGTVTITITAKESTTCQKATKKVTITVKPKRVSISKVTSPRKGKVQITWKKDTKATGYEIYYATNSNFKGAKKITISKNSATSKTISLTAGKKYYVRIRAYKKVSNKTIYGSYSTTKKITVKKK